MKIYTVSFFGHRLLSDTANIDRHLSIFLEDLIQKNLFINFLIGRNGEFDIYVASIIKQLQKKYNNSTNLTLVLPYHIANLEYYEKYYDNIIIPDKVYGSHFKAAITLKNRWMIEESDLVIVNAEINNGGAYNAMKYAEKLNKKIINLATI